MTSQTRNAIRTPEARWGRKRNERHYGYKGHVKVDRKSKLIERQHTTDASVHDSNLIAQLVEDTDKGQGCTWTPDTKAGRTW